MSATLCRSSLKLRYTWILLLLGAYLVVFHGVGQSSWTWGRVVDNYSTEPVPEECSICNALADGLKDIPVS